MTEVVRVDATPVASTWTAWAPRLQSLLRIVAAFLALSMPSRAHMEAVIQSVRSTDVTAATTPFQSPLG